jgi:hypothetical protein
MNSERIKIKSVSLTFRGFDMTPKKVESLVGVSASTLGIRGEAIKLNVETKWKRSVAKFSLSVPKDSRLDEMIPALFHLLGGVEHIREVRDQVMPEFLEIDIVLPIKGSVEQEGGFLSITSISEINTLRASLSFQFL